MKFRKEIFCLLQTGQNKIELLPSQQTSKMLTSQQIGRICFHLVSFLTSDVASHCREQSDDEKEAAFEGFLYHEPVTTLNPLLKPALGIGPRRA